MTNSRRSMFLIATIMAVGAGIILIAWMRQVEDAHAEEGVPQPIFVASKDIPARIMITPDMVMPTSRPSTQNDPDAVHDEKQLLGKITLTTIPQGGTLTSSRIGRPAEGGITVKLAPGMRAVSISIDKVKGVSGLIQPGDRVDVIAVPHYASMRAATILRGIIVLALGNVMETATGTPPPEFQNMETVTLGLTPKQADLLAAADTQTTLRLTLRSPKEPIHSLPTESLTDLAPVTPNEPPPKPELPVARAAAPPSSPTPVPTPAVTIINGDQIQK